MTLHRTLLLSCAILAGTAAQAQTAFAKPENAVKYRQSAFSLMGTHTGRIGDMVNGKVPFDAHKVQEDAALLLTLSRLPWATFSPDTQKVETSKTKPELWNEMDKVKVGADKLVAAATALDAAARTGNLDAVKKSFADTTASCKACHDAYKNK